MEKDKAKESLDTVIRKARVHLYKPIQIAEILYRDRVKSDIDLSQLETYRTRSKKWRDTICIQFLGRTGCVVLQARGVTGSKSHMRLSAVICFVLFFAGSALCGVSLPARKGKRYKNWMYTIRYMFAKKRTAPERANDKYCLGVALRDRRSRFYISCSGRGGFIFCYGVISVSKSRKCVTDVVLLGQKHRRWYVGVVQS